MIRAGSDAADEMNFPGLARKLVVETRPRQLIWMRWRSSLFQDYSRGLSIVCEGLRSTSFREATALGCWPGARLAAAAAADDEWPFLRQSMREKERKRAG